jgi:hypothetical protein
MHMHRSWRLLGAVAVAFAFGFAAFAGIGCELISNRLSKWKMLDQSAMEDPIKAVGGDAIVFAPAEDRPIRAVKLAKAPPPSWWPSTPR